MAAVVFHSGPSDIERIEHCCCQLVENLFLKGHRVLLHTSGAEQQERLNRLLWEFDADSFVPHAPTGEEDGGAPHPVVLSAGDGAAADEVLSASAFGALVIAPGGRIPPSLQQSGAAGDAEQSSGELAQIHYMVLKDGGTEQTAARQDFRALQELHGRPPQLRTFT